jgi:hypothetical protein
MWAYQMSFRRKKNLRDILVLGIFKWEAWFLELPILEILAGRDYIRYLFHLTVLKINFPSKIFSFAFAFVPV